MSKLLELREWLTIDEAARALSRQIGEELTTADLLRLAIEGKLQLSVQFVERVECIFGRLVGWSEADYESHFVDQFFPRDDTLCGFAADSFEQIDEVRGVWDVPLAGDNRRWLESLFRSLVGIAPLVPWGFNGFFVTDGATSAALLVTRDDDANAFACLTEPPDRGLLVVRTQELKRFAAHVKERLSPAPPALVIPQLEAESAELERRRMEAREGGATSPHLLLNWLKRDTWTRDEGLLLLNGLEPGPFAEGGPFRLAQERPEGGARTEQIICARYLDGSLVDLGGYRNARTLLANPALMDGLQQEAPPITSFELVDLCVRLRQLEDLWDSGNHESRCSPAYFVSWALSKGLTVEWLEWARTHGGFEYRKAVAADDVPSARHSATPASDNWCLEHCEAVGMKFELRRYQSKGEKFSGIGAAHDRAKAAGYRGSRTAFTKRLLKELNLRHERSGNAFAAMRQTIAKTHRR